MPTILVVDDEPFNLDLIAAFLQDTGYQIDLVAGGEEAWKKLLAAPDLYDTVLLDRMMPCMDGLEVLRRIKSHPKLKLLPVIMQTGATDPAEIKEGLDAGAFYYLPKPYQAAVLRTVVATAIRDRAERISETQVDEQQAGSLTEAHFKFQTVESVRQIAAFLSSLCPSPQVASLGLTELMLNAVEHGNLGVGYAEKSVLLTEDRLHDELARRLALPENSDKVAHIQFNQVGRDFVFVIQDEGLGFDWEPYLEMSMDRMMDMHGRGIAMSRSLSFSSIEYQGSGNRVVATISADAKSQ